MGTSALKINGFTLQYNMSLVTYSKVFRPWLNLFTPAADPSRFNGCRRFIFLHKPSNFVSGRLFSRHRSKRTPHRKSRWHSGHTRLVLLGCSFVVSWFYCVSMLSILIVFYLALLLGPYAPANPFSNLKHLNHH